MKYPTWPRAAAVLSLLLAGVLSHCSTDYAGGTETTNPEVSACAALVFAAFDDTTAWNARAYVPGGMDRLDSAGIYAGTAYSHPGGMLAKQWVESTDTVIGTMRIVTYTIFIDDTVLIHDTTLIHDTMFVDTTITRIDTAYDTVYAVDLQDTTRIIRTRYDTKLYVVTDMVAYTDTLFRIDTLFVNDTLVVCDTLPVDSSDSNITTTPPLINDSIAYEFVPGSPTSSRAVMDVTLVIDIAADTASLLVTQPNTAGYYVAVSPENLRITNETATQLVTKDMLSTTTGAAISETYGDLDGDGVLFGTGHQEIRFEHTYRLASDSISAAVDINGGIDNDFATVGDNPVMALFRQAFTGGRNETVSYEYTAADILSLRRHELFSDSSMEIYSRSYRLLRGDNVHTGNNDTLVSWTADALYNSGDIRRIEMTVTPDAPLAQGVKPAGAVLDATIWMRNGSVGILDSVQVHFGDGTIQGTYYKDGVAEDIVFVRWGCCM